MAVGTKASLRKATKKLGHEPQAVRFAGPFGAYGNRMLYQGAIGGILGFVLGDRLGRRPAGDHGATMALTATLAVIVDGGQLRIWSVNPMTAGLRNELAVLPLAGARLEREDKRATVWVRISSADGQVAPIELMTLARQKKITHAFLDVVAQTAGASIPQPPQA